MCSWKRQIATANHKADELAKNVALFGGAACAAQVAQDLFKVRKSIFLLQTSVRRALTVKWMIWWTWKKLQKR